METIENRAINRVEEFTGYSPDESNEYPHCSTQNCNYSYSTSCPTLFTSTGPSAVSPIGNENISPPLNYSPVSYDSASPDDSGAWEGYSYGYPTMHPNVHMGYYTGGYHPYDTRHPSHSMQPNGKPKRRRVATVAQRRAANIRERRRMFNLNEAFDELRKMVPTFAYEKRLSRIETLRLAITYISFMADVVNGKDPKEVKLTTLKPTGWCALKKLAESVNIHGVPPHLS